MFTIEEIEKGFILKKNYNLINRKIKNIYINSVKLIFLLLKLPIKKSNPIDTDNNKRRRREITKKSDPNLRFWFKNISPFKRV